MSDAPRLSTLKYAPQDSVPLGEPVTSSTPVIRKEDSVAVVDEKERPSYGPVEIISYTGWTLTIVSGVIGTLLAILGAYLFSTPVEFYPALAVLGLGLGALAAIDYKTHTIKNEHTIALAVVGIPLAIFGASQVDLTVLGTDSSGWLTLVVGAVMAILCFGVFFVLIFITGFGSGGDLKLSPVPGFILGVINPFAAIVWLFAAFVLTGIGMVLVKRFKFVAFGPGMILGVPLGLGAASLLFQVANLTYIQ